MKRLMVTLALLTAVTMSGCATQTFYVNENNASKTPTTKATSEFFFWGLTQKDTIDPESICGVNNVAAVEVEETPVNWILKMVTIGIYSPRDYRIYCKQQPKLKR